jgi:D-amino-acid dehydrogenase
MGKGVLIVGGGVVGLSTAYYCARQGDEVTVIERTPADHEGCSYGNAGLIVPSHVVPLAAPGMVKLGMKYMFDPGSPFYVKPRFNADLFKWGWGFFRAANHAHVLRAAPLIRDLNLASRRCFADLAAASGDDFGIKDLGVINLCRTEKGLKHEANIARLAERLGLAAEVVDARRARELYGDLDLNVIGGVYYPQDCFLSPSRFMAALKRLVMQSGIKIEWGTEATGWRPNGPQISAVHTSNGDHTADEYVICSGSWSPRVGRGLDLRIPIEAGKGYSLTLSNPPRLPRIAAILSESRVAITPMGTSLRVGGTMEIAGLDESITMRRVNRIIAAACRYLPDFTPEDFRNISPWHGLRPVTPDGLPFVGRTGRYANLSVAAGHAMMGFSLGPITGKLISEVLAGSSSSININLLSPDRYR